MKSIKLLALAIFVSALTGVLTPVLSQENPDTRSANTERYEDDNDNNYSWIGLLGLIGLAGLYKRPADKRTERDTIPSGKARYSPEA